MAEKNDKYGSHFVKTLYYLPSVCPGVARTSNSWFPNLILVPGSTRRSAFAPLALEMMDLQDGISFFRSPVPVIWSACMCVLTWKRDWPTYVANFLLKRPGIDWVCEPAGILGISRNSQLIRGPPHKKRKCMYTRMRCVSSFVHM